MGKRSKFPDKQVLMGYNSAEGLLALSRLDKDPKEIDNTLEDPERVIPDSFKLRSRGSEESVKKAIKNMLESYTQTDNTRKYIDLMGDAWFDYGIFRTLQSIIKTNDRSKNTYFYKLSDDSYSVYKTYILTKYKNQPGVCHGDDLGYLFKMYYAGFVPLPIPRGGHKTNQILVKFWVNFAKNGDPNSSTDETLKDITWQPVNKNNIKYLDITKDSTPSMTSYTKDEKK
uniref:Putative truncated esterase n=1 Tax=Xenopsylla cheopis TaxID=163159 RepID=A2IA76_XENCH|nr:putative truncated esterase [Xenopsylla cheopis]